MKKPALIAVLGAIIVLGLILTSTWATGQVQQTKPKTPPRVNLPRPAPPPSDQGEVVQETNRRQGETLKGLWIVEQYQKGIGRNIEMTVTCPADTLAIGAGGENSGMPVFFMRESYPLGGDRWRVKFARDMSPLNPGQTGVVDLHPPSPYQITVTVYCVNRTVWNRVMNSQK
jgi:hypothetical protein